MPFVIKVDSHDLEMLKHRKKTFSTSNKSIHLKMQIEYQERKNSALINIRLIHR